MRKKLLKIGCALALLLCLIWARGALGQLFMSILLAALLSFLLLPVQKLYEKALPAPISAMLTLLSAVVVVGLLLYFTIPRLVNQIVLFAEALPSFFEQAQGWIKVLVERAKEIGLPVEEALTQLEALPGSLSMPDLSGIMAGIGSMGKYLLSPVFMYYFLAERKSLFDALNRWLPSKYRAPVRKCADDMRLFFSSYLRGQLLICLVTGFFTAIGLAIVGVDAYLLLGILMALFNLIPYFGPIIGIVPIVIFSMTQGWKTAIWAVVVSVAVQQLEGSFITPKIMSSTAGFHPGVVVALIFLGSALFGVWGMILIIPFATLVKTIWTSILARKLYPAHSE